MESHAKGEVLTGIFYVDTEKPSFIDQLNLVDDPLGTLPRGAHAAFQGSVRRDHGETSLEEFCRKVERLRIARSLFLFERALAGDGRKRFERGLLRALFLLAAVLGTGTRFGEVCVFSVVGLVDAAVNYLTIERHILALGWPIIFNCTFASVGIGVLHKISHGSRCTDAGILPLVARLCKWKDWAIEQAPEWVIVPGRRRAWVKCVCPTH